MYTLSRDINPLPKDKILEGSKVKGFSEHNIKMTRNFKFVLER